MTQRDSTVVSLDKARQTPPPPPPERLGEERRRALDRFLATVERQAFQRARMAVGNVEDALEVVQEAMLKLSRRYSDKPEEEWPLLFQRVLQNCITDFHRRRNVRSRVLSWIRLGPDEPQEAEEEMQVADPSGRSPLENLLSGIATEKLLGALEQLPVKQQQAFLLRHWDGYSTTEAAYALSCSEGSVKTHLSRALKSLRHTL
ncbi:MAG: RNA polymerase sigma factor [Oleiphilaceae bacterium]|nr:RNA polymerase sigma factor [Oleiphilaceae bacterium]